MKIYTKTGDAGKSRLVGGTSISKTHDRLEAYGSVDELNSLLGVCASEVKTLSPTLNDEIRRVQNDLFYIGSRLAAETDDVFNMMPPLPSDSTALLENSIDKMQAQLAPLKQFILPGGSRPTSLLHLARTVCRRAERASVGIFETEQPLLLNDIQYLNRLSDYLFVAARFVNHLQSEPDVFWQK